MRNHRALTAAAAGFVAGCFLTHFASLHPLAPRPLYFHGPSQLEGAAPNTSRSMVAPVRATLKNVAAIPPATHPHPLQSFPDVSPKHWAYAAVEGLMHRHILDSGSRRRFAGEQPITRFEMALALYRMVRYLEPSHGPAEPGAPGNSPAAWLIKNDYLLGDTMLAQPPSTATVSTGLLSESLAYVSDRVLLHRAPPGESNDEN